MGIKCCHENKIFEKYLKYELQNQPTDVLLMFPREDRDGDMGPMVACTLIFATIATIGILVFAYQYAK